VRAAALSGDRGSADRRYGAAASLASGVTGGHGPEPLPPQPCQAPPPRAPAQVGSAVAPRYPSGTTTGEGRAAPRTRTTGRCGHPGAEADGNRTRLTEMLGHVGFEDRGGHQTPRRLPCHRGTGQEREPAPAACSRRYPRSPTGPGTGVSDGTASRPDPSIPAVDLTEPFRGSAAIASGAVTAGRLRGRAFRRLFTDIYVRADVEPDLALRSRGAFLLVAGRGVLGGYSAAELLGASCGSREAPAEVVVPGGGRSPQPGLRVHSGRLAPGETTRAGDVALTTPVRTAYDLARRTPLTEAVVALDVDHRAAAGGRCAASALAGRRTGSGGARPGRPPPRCRAGRAGAVLVTAVSERCPAFGGWSRSGSCGSRRQRLSATSPPRRPGPS
jgi:hypothetical protein